MERGLFLCVGCAHYVSKNDSKQFVDSWLTGGSTKGWEAIQNCDFPDVKSVLCKICASINSTTRCWECAKSNVSGGPDYPSDRCITVLVRNPPENQVLPFLTDLASGKMWNLRFRQLQNCGPCSPLVIDLPKDMSSRGELHISNMYPNYFCRDIQIHINPIDTLYGSNGYPVSRHFVRHYERNPWEAWRLTWQKIASILEPFARVSRNAYSFPRRDTICVKLEDRQDVWGWQIAETFQDEYGASHISFLSMVTRLIGNSWRDTKWFKLKDIQKLWFKVNAIRKLVGRNWSGIHYRLWGPNGIMANKGWGIVSELLYQNSIVDSS